jgi:NHL repeat
MVRSAKNLASVATSLCLATVLSGCAASPTGFAPPAPGGFSPTAVHESKRPVSIHIRIPKRHPHERGAHYVSPATKGMLISLTGASMLTQAIDLTPSDPRCSGSPVVCTIAIQLAPGIYSAAVTTYDRAPVGGAIPTGANQLSIAHGVPLTVMLSAANEFNVALDGVPASISIGALPAGSLGTAFPSARAFAVTVKDADAYAIVGTYGTPVTLTDSDVTGATAVATTGSDHPAAGELLSSGDIAAMSYNGKPVTSVTIGASAGSISTTAAFTASTPLYVSDTYNNAVKELTGGCTADSCASALGSGFSHPTGIAVDKSGNVFVADYLNNAVKEIPVGGGTIQTLGGGFSNPSSVAVDGSGNVFVSDSGNNRVKEIMAVNGVVPASATVVTLGFGLNAPGGVALDSAGDVFVSDSGNNAVKEFEAVNGAVPPNPANPTTLTLGSGFNSPAGVAVDTAGNVFVADDGNHAVKEILAVGGSVLTLDSAFVETLGIAIDAAGNVYVSDDIAGTVTELEAVDGSIPPTPTASVFASGFDDPTGIAVP